MGEVVQLDDGAIIEGWRRDAVAAALRGAAADLGLAIRVDVAWRTL